MIRKTIVFPNHEPLTRSHAAQLVQIASRFDARIMIEHDASVVNAKSMLGLLSLGMDARKELTLRVDGTDEQAAADAISKLLNEGFEAEKG